MEDPIVETPTIPELPEQPTENPLIPETVTQLRWGNAEHTAFLAHVTLKDGSSFDAVVLDGDLPHVQHVWDKAMAGDYGAIAEYVPPPPQIPDRVSSRQFKLQLHSAGLLNQVDAWIALQDVPTQIAYASSGTFVRTDPMMQAGFAALGFTPQQIDNFYLAASTL